MLQTPSLLAVAIPTLVVGVAVGCSSAGAARGARACVDGGRALDETGGRRSIRSQALLEAAAEPVLLVGADGRVLDCMPRR
jgi:hypothetical protein